MPDIQSMIGKEVEVVANGISYQGILMEVSDTDVHLKTTMQWVSLPVVAVSAIKLAGADTAGFNRESLFSGGMQPLE